MSRRRPDVVVIGGGVGGLSVAIRLQAAGHHVTVLERSGVVGGKLAVYERDGFTFDIGPSLVTLPHLLDETFRAAGTSLFDEVELTRLDPQFHYHWREDDRRGAGSLVVHDDADATADAFQEFAPGADDEWREFDARGRTIWDIAERTFFAGPMESPLSLVSRMQSPRDLLDIDAGRTLWTAARRTFTDERLHQWAGRYATYSGSSPFEAPATLACIPHVESRFGCWYPAGGLAALRDAYERVATGMGVSIVNGAEVIGIQHAPSQVTGVQLADGSYVDASVVIANVDARHLYGDLLPDDHALHRVRRAGRSTSGFVLCLGVRDRTPGIGHHNVWFSADFQQEFRALANGQLAEDPTIYGCVSAVTDPTQAPDGDENWFLLVNTPPGVEVDSEDYRDVVLARLAQHGVDLRKRLRFAAHLTPADIEERYRSPGGAIYGTSSNGRNAAFRRPANRGPIGGLYLVGGSSHPGGGLPLVSSSARIVADLVADDIA
ncbi:MAG: phytoene desaturase family protein [Actinomycetota bacterium]